MKAYKQAMLLLTLIMNMLMHACMQNHSQHNVEQS